MAERIEKTSQSLQTKFKRFSRVEKAFYLSIALTTIVLAISVVFMQTKLLQVQNELTKVNELIRSERLKEIADKKDLKLNNENIRTAE